MKINCEKCKNSCCGDIKDLVPILFPFEEKFFKKHARKITTSYRDVFLLKRKKNGKCVFLNEADKKCSIYEKRPTECRIYPYLIAFEGFKVNIKLDKRFCTQADLAKNEKKSILEQLRKIKFPKSWIKADRSKIIQKQTNAVD